VVGTLDPTCTSFLLLAPRLHGRWVNRLTQVPGIPSSTMMRALGSQRNLTAGLRRASIGTDFHRHVADSKVRKRAPLCAPKTMFFLTPFVRLS